MVAALVAVALTVPAAAPAPAAAACANRDAHPADVSLKKVKRATLCLINRERTKRGRSKLRANRRLAKAARLHARDMVRNDYFAHTSPTGLAFDTRILRTDYADGTDGYLIGENLAWGSMELATPRLIVKEWMRSPGHRANILKRGYREVGVGIVRGAPTPGVSRAATYATEFGKRF